MLESRRWMLRRDELARADGGRSGMSMTAEVPFQAHIECYLMSLASSLRLRGSRGTSIQACSPRAGGEASQPGALSSADPQ